MLGDRNLLGECRFKERPGRGVDSAIETSEVSDDQWGYRDDVNVTGFR